jgi:hypothetical protein
MDRYFPENRKANCLDTAARYFEKIGKFLNGMKSKVGYYLEHARQDLNPRPTD